MFRPARSRRQAGAYEELARTVRAGCRMRSVTVSHGCLLPSDHTPYKQEVDGSIPSPPIVGDDRTIGLLSETPPSSPPWACAPSPDAARGGGTPSAQAPSALRMACAKSR